MSLIDVAAALLGLDRSVRPRQLYGVVWRCPCGECRTRGAAVIRAEDIEDLMRVVEEMTSAEGYIAVTETHCETVLQFGTVLSDDAISGAKDFIRCQRRLGRVTPSDLVTLDGKFGLML